MNRVKAILVALVTGLLFFASSGIASAQINIPLKNSVWNLYGSWYQGSPHPKNTTGGIYFDFPQSSTGSFVGYYTASQRLTLAPSNTLSMTFTLNTTGSPVFNHMSEASNTCPNPSTVRPFFWGTGDVINDGRWWSNPVSYVLAGGTVTLTVPMTSDHWSGVYGMMANRDTSTEQSFLTALSTVNRIGMTFGGGCSFGHGINVISGTGTANFVLQSYTIN